MFRSIVIRMEKLNFKSIPFAFSIVAVSELSLQLSSSSILGAR